MKKLFLILGLFSILLFIVNVRAQIDIDSQSIIKSVFVDIFSFPEEWFNSKDIIFYGFIPFTAIWIIIYGFLDRIRIFRRKKLNGLLSFLIAFSTLPMRLFILIVVTLFAIMGVYSVAMFAIIFVIGVFLFSRGIVWTWKKEFGHYDMAVAGVDDQINFLRERVLKIEQDINKIKDDPHFNRTNISTLSELEDFENEKKKWEDRIRLLELKKRHIRGQKEAAKTFADLEERT